MYNERIGTKYFRGMLRLAIFKGAFFMYTSNFEYLQEIGNEGLFGFIYKA